MEKGENLPEEKYGTFPSACVTKGYFHPAGLGVASVNKNETNY